MGDKVVVSLFLIVCLLGWCLSLKPEIYCEIYAAFYGEKRAKKYGPMQARLVRWIGPIFVIMGLYQLLITFGIDLSRLGL